MGAPSHHRGGSATIDLRRRTRGRKFRAPDSRMPSGRDVLMFALMGMECAISNGCAPGLAGRYQRINVINHGDASPYTDSGHFKIKQTLTFIARFGLLSAFLGGWQGARVDVFVFVLEKLIKSIDAPTYFLFIPNQQHLSATVWGPGTSAHSYYSTL